MYIGIIPPVRFDPEHHITLTFNGRGENKQSYLSAVVALAKAARWWHINNAGLIPIKFGETREFPANEFRDGVVKYVSVDSHKLHRFRDILTASLAEEGVYYSQDFDYTPHMTLGYGPQPVGNPYEGTEFLVPTLSVMSSAFGRTDIQV